MEIAQAKGASGEDLFDFDSLQDLLEESEEIKEEVAEKQKEEDEEQQ